MGCGEWHLKRCGGARASQCEFCAEEHRRDVAAIGRSGWTDRPEDRGYFTTLTAPSFKWDTSQCVHSSGVPCSGSIGCVADAHELAIWHNGLGLRWSHFVTLLRRLLGVEVEFFKTWEAQKRGALHAHAMLRVGAGVSEKRVRAAIRYASRRPWINFGPQHDVQVVDLSRRGLGDDRQTARAAGYCAKYATKGADDLRDVTKLDAVTGELVVGGFRPWSASRSWGDTMRLVKLRRRVWAAGDPLRAAGDAAGAAGALDLYRDHYADVSSVVVVLGSSEGSGAV